MYKYSKIKKGSHDLYQNQPSNEMMINGKYLSDLLNGYRQLHVSGRFLIDQDVDITSIPMRSGGWLNHATDKVRTIEIKYQIIAESSFELRDTFATFNSILREVQSDGLLEVRFKDELSWEYRGVFTTSDTPPEQALSFTATFALLMPDPFKYKILQSSMNTISLIDAKRVLPHKIIATTTQTASFAIVNGNKRIPFTGSYSTGGKITITFDSDTVSIMYNGRSIESELMWVNDLEVFYLEDGDIITGENCSIESVEWRDKRQ